MLIGGASALNLLLSLVRNKALALMLGPAGFGLLSLYMAILDVARSVSGMGVNQSGVRQIAASAAEGGMERVSTTAYVLRRTSVVLGLLGGVALVLLAKPIAVVTFGDGEHEGAVRLLGAALFLTLAADGQTTLVLGLRRIGNLAKVHVLSGLYSTVALIAITYALGERGIVPAIVLGAALTLVTAVWYVRRLEVVAPVRVDLRTVVNEAADLLKLGTAFMVSGFVMMGAAYAVRTIVSSAEDLQAAGVYQAAWTIGGLYTWFILQAMGADFYPRLVGAIGDVNQRSRLINEQTIAGVTLAAPGIAATMALAPLALSWLYSDEFRPADGTLRWICFGMALRLVTWPPGTLIVAMNERLVFIATEIAWAVTNVGLTLLLVPHFGLEGAGIAFAASYACHGVVVYTIGYARYRFRPSRSASLAGAAFIIAAIAVLGSFSVLEESAATVFSLCVAAGVGVLSMRALVTMVPADRLPRPLARCLQFAHLMKRKLA